MNIPQATKEKLLTLIAEGKKLEAVKFVKDEFGLALKDSLKLVEAMERDASMRNSSPFQKTGFAGPDKVFSIVSAIFLGVSILLFLIGAKLAFDTNHELTHALKLKGKVVEFAYGSNGGYIPIVEFLYNGSNRRHQGSVASTPPAYDLGEEVTVYISNDGEEKVLLEGIFELWIGPLILAFIGSIFLFIGGGMYAINRKM